MPTEAGDFPSEASEDRPAEKRPAIIDSYFTFKLGGQGFAVDERLVVKAGKGDGRIVKKARKTGALTIQDTKRKFFGTRHGLEPAWEDLPTEELKNTLFPVVTSDRLAGLHESEGGGVLFLANRDRRAVLLTDGIPEKVVLSEEYEVNPSDDQDFVTGAIKKKGEEEGHLILDMAQIV
jgi:hypothetical protein